MISQMMERGQIYNQIWDQVEKHVGIQIFVQDENQTIIVMSRVKNRVWDQIDDQIGNKFYDIRFKNTFS